MNVLQDVFPQLNRQVECHPYPLVFATISGAHLYGFPSPDSDFDLRGIHRLPVDQLLGLYEPEETVEKDGIHDGLEIDLVTHDVKKFMILMLKRNGYVLEQLLSPLVVYTTPHHTAMKELAPKCITRYHAFHYLGFAETQWNLFRKEEPPRVKPLLYVFRVLLTGIHLMRSGEVEANLVTLNLEAKLPYIADLVARKTTGPEKGTLDSTEMTFFQSEFERLRALLETAHKESQLPEGPSCKEELNRLLIDIRNNLATS